MNNFYVIQIGFKSHNDKIFYLGSNGILVDNKEQAVLYTEQNKESAERLSKTWVRAMVVPFSEEEDIDTKDIVFSFVHSATLKTAAESYNKFSKQNVSIKFADVVGDVPQAKIKIGEKEFLLQVIALPGTW